MSLSKEVKAAVLTTALELTLYELNHVKEGSVPTRGEAAEILDLWVYKVRTIAETRLGED